MYATLNDVTIKLTGFSFREKNFRFHEMILWPTNHLNFITQKMSISFQDLIQRGSALVHIDAIMIMSISKPHMLQFINQIHDIAKRE